MPHEKLRTASMAAVKNTSSSAFDIMRFLRIDNKASTSLENGTPSTLSQFARSCLAYWSSLLGRPARRLKSLVAFIVTVISEPLKDVIEFPCIGATVRFTTCELTASKLERVYFVGNARSNASFDALWLLLNISKRADDVSPCCRFCVTSPKQILLKKNSCGAPR